MDHRDDGTSATRISLVDCFTSVLIVVIDNIIIQSNTVDHDSKDRVV